MSDTTTLPAPAFTEADTETGLIADIYKPATRPDASNGGISSRAREVLVVNAAGPFGQMGGRRPAVKIVEGNLPGTVKAVVVDPPGGIGPMFGGCYIAGDSRITELVEKILGHRFDGAVPLHDRYETAAESEALSV